jgi:hypothetical protein
MQLVRNFLVKFGLRDQADNLFFPETKSGIERPEGRFRSPTGWTNPTAAITSEFHSAPKTVSHQADRPHFNRELKVMYH